MKVRRFTERRKLLPSARRRAPGKKIAPAGRFADAFDRSSTRRASPRFGGAASRGPRQKCGRDVPINATFN